MKSSRRAGLAAILFVAYPTVAFCQAPPVRRTALTVAAIAKQNTQAVVTILTPNGTGSGVIVNPAGVIVTNLHVLQGETKASVKLSNGDLYDDVTVIDVDERKDLLLIKIKAFGLPAVTLGDSDQVAVGGSVTLIGAPRGLESTVSNGIISATRDSGEGYRLFQTNAAASSGSSGGGMFNDAGQLIGIVTLKISNGENLNFAVPINYVRGLLSTQSRMTLGELAQRHPAQRGAEDTAVSSRGLNLAASDRIGEIFAASGLKFSKPNDSLWKVVYDGSAGEDVEVFAKVIDELLIVSSTVGADATLTEAQMRTMLTLNYEADLAKLSVSDTRDLLVLNETEHRLLDAAALKKIFDHVASLADEAAEVVSGRAAAETRTSLVSPSGTGLSTLELNPGGAVLRYRSGDWVSDSSEVKDEPGVRRSQFRHRNGEIWVSSISERSEIAVDQVMELALTNAREMDPKARAIQRGQRTVNGRTLRFQELEASSNGVSVVLYCHFFSDATGTYQLMGWTTKNLFPQHRATIESWVAGFQAR